MNNISIVIIVLVIMTSCFFHLSRIYAYMSDRATASGVFTAEFVTVTPAEEPTPTVVPTSFPTQTPTPVPSINHILINEISTRGSEWIELYNPTGTTVSLTNWMIRDNSANAPDIFQGSIALPSGAYAIVIGKNQTPPTIPPDTLIIEVDDNVLGNGLTDAGDKVELLNDASEVQDAVSYGNVGIIGFTTPLPNPGTNQSFDRTSTQVDTDTSADWAVSSTPSPGNPNTL
jgi:Lamin Tail Domain